MPRKRNPASVDALERFTSTELKRMPTLAVGQAEDLKYDDGEHRWWIDRVGPESGATHKVSVEELLPTGLWRTVHEYEPYASMNPAKCGRGKIRRKGYSRKGYTRKDGSRVRRTKVSSRCIKDRGRRGKGPKVVKITDEGKLGGKGYLKKSAATRHRLLARCVKEDGYRSCLGSLNALAVLGKRTFSQADLKKIAADRNWLVKKYGGKGSFKRSKNPEIRRLRNRLMNG